MDNRPHKKEKAEAVKVILFAAAVVHYRFSMSALKYPYYDTIRPG